MWLALKEEPDLLNLAEGGFTVPYQSIAATQLAADQTTKQPALAEDCT